MGPQSPSNFDRRKHVVQTKTIRVFLMDLMEKLIVVQNEHREVFLHRSAPKYIVFLHWFLEENHLSCDDFIFYICLSNFSSTSPLRDPTPSHRSFPLIFPSPYKRRIPCLWSNSTICENDECLSD